MAKKNDPKRKITKEGLKKALRIFRYVRPQRSVFIVGMILLLASSIAGLVVPGLLGQMAGVGLEPTGSMPRSFFRFSLDFSDINTLFVLLIVLFLIQGVIAFFRVYTFAYFTENMMLALRRDTYEQVIRMPMNFFNSKRVGDLNSRMSSDITTIQETFTTTMAEFIRQVIVIVFGVALLFYYSSTLTFFMLATIPVIVISAVVFGRYIRKLGKQTQEKVSSSSVVVEETLTAIAAVKSFANEFFETLRYGQQAESIRKYAMKSAVWRGVFSSFIIIFLFGAISFVIWQGLQLKEAGEMSTADFMSFLLYTAMVGGSFGGLASQYAAMQRGIGAIEDVMDILDLTPEPVRLEKHVTEKILKGDIAFDNVKFNYESRPDIAVIKGVSFSIKAGQQIAIVGPSGAGKSSLISLILQFYQPNEGHIAFDAKAANDYDLTDLRCQMALVPQEVILFGGSIRENIAYGKPEADEAEIMEAARQANALEFIQKFPEGLDTLVGERGVQLSGGQRQRIAIARAVLRNPAILILDEATSSLDSESERLVQDALEKLMKGRTSVVIAHRLSTIQHADRILVIDQGELVEEGSHEELMANSEGVYHHLSRLQFSKA